ncbi:hypothetical protein ABW20_dc0108915 [Dactylellina cionopaga]|nr:hypothetical protein ABW20_dc0108915 [Dactylellina cionopaga]
MSTSSPPAAQTAAAAAQPNITSTTEGQVTTIQHTEIEADSTSYSDTDSLLQSEEFVALSRFCIFPFQVAQQGCTLCDAPDDAVYEPQKMLMYGTYYPKTVQAATQLVYRVL